MGDLKTACPLRSTVNPSVPTIPALCILVGVSFWYKLLCQPIRSQVCLCHRNPVKLAAQGNESINFNKGKMKAARVIYFSLAKVNLLISLRDKFDRILVAKTETWLLIGWHK